MPAYDIIGDIHGHLQPLETLLASLGYRRQLGVWGHPERQALFLGDLIDRGPDQLGVLTAVRSMVDAGNALITLGNHEFNGIGFASKGADGRWLRQHGSKNRHQHAAFLDAVGEGSPLHAEYIDWFKSIPLWLDLDAIRLVHACWHPEQIELLQFELEGSRLTPQTLEAAFTRGLPLSNAAEIVLKGPEVALPENVVFHDKDGHARRNTRIRWWDETALTYRQAAIVDAGTASMLPDAPLPPSARFSLGQGAPVFFGHYWMNGSPTLVSPKAACLDFSIAKDGVLAAYSWDGETELDPAKLSWAGHPAPDTASVPDFA